MRALELLAAGDFTAAAGVWDRIASAERDFAAVRFAHDVYLHVGDDERRLASSSHAVEAWRGKPGWGFVAGQHAFALEEVGRYGAAEELGWTALAIDADDLWARHALAHVYESTDDTPAALDLLEGSVDRWDEQDLLATHIWWHLALRLLARGDRAAAVAVFDDRRPHATTAFQLCARRRCCGGSNWTAATAETVGTSSPTGGTRPPSGTRARSSTCMPLWCSPAGPTIRAAAAGSRA